MLCQALLTNNQVLLVSEAVVHPNGTGTCAWTIWATSELWSGKGYVPGTIEDMYSGLAKAYGLYTVISFLNHYMTLYPLVLPAPRTIHVYCDNNGVIEHLNTTLNQQYPRDSIRDDYLVFAAIHHVIHQAPMLCILFHHVKGHQKETLDWKLTLPKKLNIDSDARASRMQPIPSNSLICQNLLTDGGYPHLCIQQQCIAQQIQHTLQDAVTQQPYFEYLQQKFDWEHTPDSTVQWLIIHQTL